MVKLSIISVTNNTPQNMASASITHVSLNTIHDVLV